LLAPEIQEPTDDSVREKQSFMINSPSNLSEQGHCVPWCFGKEFFIGSVVVSNGIAVEDFD
jgi:predicted phage tail protein